MGGSRIIRVWSSFPLGLSGFGLGTHSPSPYQARAPLNPPLHADLQEHPVAQAIAGSQQARCVGTPSLVERCSWLRVRKLLSVSFVLRRLTGISFLSRQMQRILWGSLHSCSFYIRSVFSSAAVLAYLLV